MTSRLAILCTLALTACACTPRTDVVDMNTESVGDYALLATSSTPRGLTATVCVDQPDHAPAIVDRIVDQMKSHSFAAVTLDVITPAPAGRTAAVEHVVWTPSQGVRPAAPAAAPAGQRCESHWGRVSLTSGDRQ